VLVRTVTGGDVIRVGGVAILFEGWDPDSHEARLMFGGEGSVIPPENLGIDLVGNGFHGPFHLRRGQVVALRTGAGVDGGSFSLKRPSGRHTRIYIDAPRSVSIHHQQSESERT